MKMCKVLKRIVSLVIVIAMLAAGNEWQVFAETLSGNEIPKEVVTEDGGKENITTQSEIQVEGEDSFGELFSEAIESEVTDLDTGYSIFSVKVNGNVATVNYYSVEEANLVVGIYDEKGKKLLATGTAVVSAEEDVANVTIDMDIMPEYFYVKAYLVDVETLAPICKMYETPNYTKEMQDFLAKTVNDFEEGRVYNLDSDTTNNFAVFSDEVIIKEQKEESNIVSYADETEQKYIISNADEDVMSLGEGDIYAYKTKEGILIIKVSAIEIEGSQVTIYGSETSIEDVFDYIKIDTTAGMEAATFDDSEADSCVTYKGVAEKANTDENVDAEEVPAEKVFEGELNSSNEFTFDLFEADMVSGNVGIDVGVGLTYYLSLSYQAIDLYFEVNANFEVELSSDLDGFKAKLGRVPFSVFPGVKIALVVYFKIEADVALTLEGGIKTKFGVSYNSDTGAKEIKEIKPYIEVTVDGKLFVGFEFDPQVEIIKDKVCYIGGEVNAGVQLSGSRTLFEEESTEDEWHKCVLCFDGDIKGVVSFALKGKLFNSEKLGFTLNIATLSFKIKDWYFSDDLKQFGFGLCPNRSMKLAVTVKDHKGRLMNNAKVSAHPQKSSESVFVKSFPDTVNGKTEAYLEKGTYTIEAELPGYENKQQKIKINNKRRDIIIYFDRVNNVSLIPDDTDSQNDYSLYEEQTVINNTFKGNVKQVEVGGYNSLAIVTKDNELYVTDKVLFPDNGDLGSPVPHKMMEDVERVVMTDDFYPRVEGEHTNATIYAIIQTNGSLYTLGHYYDYENEVDVIMPLQKVMNNVKDISIGQDHFVALTKDGSVYTWGDNSIGQLGLGVHGGYYETPQKVLGNVKSICAGRYITFAVLKNGDLYFSGTRMDLFDTDNLYVNEGNMGHSYSKNFTFYMSNIEYVSTDSGWCDIMMITMDKKLYHFITPGYSLRSEWDNYVELPEYTMNYVMDNVAMVGTSYGSFYAINQRGDLYMWGEVINNAQPQKIMENIAEASMSYGNSVVIDKKGEVYFVNRLGGAMGHYMQFASGCKDMYIHKWGQSFAYISLDGDLFTYGRNIDGLLGNGTKEDNYTEYECILHNAERFVEMGDCRYGAITEAGELYVWGTRYMTEGIFAPRKVADNVLGATGGYFVTRDFELYSFSISDAGVVSTQKYASNVKQYVGSLSGYAYYITTDGELVRKKYSYSTPELIASNVKIAKMTDIIAYLTEDNRLYISDSYIEFSEVLSEVVDFAAYYDGFDEPSYAAVKKDGSLWLWGCNEEGRLADNTGVKSYEEPVQVYDHVSKIKFNGDMRNVEYAFITDKGEGYVYKPNLNGEILNAGMKCKFPTKLNMDYYLSLYDEIESPIQGETCMADEKEEVTADKLQNYTSVTITDKTGTDNYNNLIPNMTYNYYIVDNIDNEDIITSDNLIYISQGVTDDEGKLRFSYQTDVEFSDAVSFVVPMSCDEIGMASGTINCSVNTEEDLVQISLTTDAVLPMVEFAVTGNGTDQTKTVWIKSKLDDNGSYVSTMPMSVFDYTKGLYKVEAIGEDFYMNRGTVASSQFETTKEFLIIRYKLNDDAFSPAMNSESNLEKYEVGGSDIILQSASRKGYVFGGWYADNQYTTKIDVISRTTEKEVTLYAKWLEKNANQNNQGDNQNQTTNNSTEETKNSIVVGSKVEISDTKAIYKVTASDNGNRTVSYVASSDKNITEVVIPKTINISGVEYKVTALEKDAFKKYTKLTKVILGENITTIGKNAFYGCKKLKNVTLGKNVTTIGENAFYKCTSLMKITIPSKVKTIGTGVFYGCKKLKNVTLGKNVTTIGDKAFYKCTSLTKITIPSKVSKIGKQAFYGCKKLANLAVKTTKLTSKRVGGKAFKGIKSTVTVKVPKKKYSAYKKLLKSKGVNSRAKYKKI